MNGDLKAYVDGELPPDAAERLRAALAADPALAREAESIRRLSDALRRLPEPEPVGQRATLAALARPARPLWQVWLPALAGCTVLLLVLAPLQMQAKSAAKRTRLAVYERPASIAAAKSARTLRAGQDDLSSDGRSPSFVDATKIELPIVPLRRRAEAEAFVRSVGGTISVDKGLARARYPQASHERFLEKIGLPKSLHWQAEGVKFRFEG